MTAAETLGQLSELSENVLTGQGTSPFNLSYVNPQECLRAALGRPRLPMPLGA